MARPSAPPPPRNVLVDLLGTALLAGAIYIVLVLLPGRLLPRLSGTELLLLEAGGVLLVAYLVARVLTRAATAVILRRGEFARGHAVRLFLNLLVAVAAILALSKVAGVSAESILLGSAFAGIVLGLAAQTVLANVFAGLLLVVSDPFRPGDRVGFVSSNYGIVGSSYPHEMTYPAYVGTVADIGLVYTVVALDRGGLAKVPNNVVMSALVLLPDGPAVHRIRMTFPQTVAVATVESAVRELAGALPAPAGGPSGPRLEVADISATTWDGVVVLAGPEPDGGALRDRVLRAVLARLPAPGAAPGRPAP